MRHVTRLQRKDFSADLDEIARAGARRMLAEALEADVADYLARNQERDEKGRAQVVRNGKARARKVTLGSGTIEVRAPRVDDRREREDGSRRRFTSQILPPYMRRSPKVAEVLPILYLRGLSTGDFKEGLAALLGDDASGLSPTAITRLTAAWQADYEAFQKRDLSECDYVYVWADGVHFRIRLEEDRLCALVMIGVRPDGTKELIAIEDGYRESAESWSTVLRGLKRRGMRAPVLGRTRLLEGAPRRMAGDARAALLGAPDRQRPRQASEAPPCEGQGGASRDHARRDAEGSSASHRAVRGRLRGEVPKGRGLAAPG
jgi:transposase-like protein